MSETYIMSVPETGENRELTAEQIRAELAQGSISSAYWVWSAEHQDWKQISELPTLWAAPAPAAIPVPVFVPPQAEQAAPAVGTTTGIPLPVKKAAVIPVAAVKAMPVKAMPRVEPVITPVTVAQPAVKKKKPVINTRSIHVEHDAGFPWVKFFFEALYIGIAVVIGLNYIVLDKPLNEMLSHTPFVLVPVHAHMGSFVQPNAMVVHLLPTKELSNENLPDFLQTLAASTPTQPFSGNEAAIQIIEMTSGWESEFSMSGDDWRKLAGMTKASTDERRDFISDSLRSISGQPLIPHSDRTDPVDWQTARNKVWSDFSTEMLNNPTLSAILSKLPGSG